MYRLAVIALVVVLAGLQYRLWIGGGSWAEVHRLSEARQALAAENDARLHRNDALQAEIDNLKSGEGAIEGRVRADLGMIKRDEQFFLTVAPHGDDAAARSTPN